MLIDDYQDSAVWARDAETLGATVEAVDTREWEATVGGELVGWFKGGADEWGFLGTDAALVAHWLNQGYRRATRRQAG